MTKKTIICLFFCLLFTVCASAAVKKKPTVTKSAKEISELKLKLAASEARNVSLTAKIAMLEKNVEKLKKDGNLKLTIAAGAGGLALLLGFIMFAGAISKGGQPKEAKKKTLPGREKHFEELEYHVLDDWQNIWFHPENIDMKLFDDLKNHFPGIHADMTDWKACMHKRNTLAEELGQDMEKTHPDVVTMPFIYLLAYENPDFFIEKNEIKSGAYVCAHAKDGSQGSHEMMNAYYEECVKMFAKKPYSEIKNLNGDIIGLKNSVDLAIRKIKFTRELPGDCGYLKA